MATINKQNLVKPSVGGSINLWGNMLNENFDKILVFMSEVILDSSNKDQAITKLEKDKINRQELDVIVGEKVDNYVETTVKPNIDNYLDTVSKVELDKYVVQKKSDLDNYNTTVKKPELDTHTNLKKGELDTYEKAKETQLNDYTGVKKKDLDSYTLTKKTELDTHKDLKIQELDSHTTLKEQAITKHTDNEIVRVTNHTNTKIGELDTHVATKKSELDAYEKLREKDLDSYTLTKKTELDNHTIVKQGDLDKYEKVKENELSAFSVTEKEAITNHTTSKISEITLHTNNEKIRITSHTDKEILRVTQEGDRQINLIKQQGASYGTDISNLKTNKLDKGAYGGTAQDLKDAIDKVNTDASNTYIKKVGGESTGSFTVGDGNLLIKSLSQASAKIPSVIISDTTGSKVQLSYNGTTAELKNLVSKKSIVLSDNGNGEYPAENLAYYDKEVVAVLNNLYKRLILNEPTNSDYHSLKVSRDENISSPALQPTIM